MSITIYYTAYLLPHSTKRENKNHYDSLLLRNKKHGRGKNLDNLYETTIFNCWHQIEIRLLRFTAEKKRSPQFPFNKMSWKKTREMNRNKLECNSKKRNGITNKYSCGRNEYNM